MAANAELWMSFDDIYRPALSIPVDTCRRFSLHPLAWLRYVGYTIYDNEGHISTTPDGPEVDYYQGNIPPSIYYYVSQEPLLLDPNGMDDRTSDASTISTSLSRADFRDRVAARDGNCVLTASTDVEACRIIPHAKGDQAKYMINLVNYRNEPLDPPLDDINDTRNGILLSTGLQYSFVVSEVAFLRTPNFAMTVNDVDLVTQPTAHLLGFAIQPSVANTRLIFQHFNTADILLPIVAPHNSDARQSDSDEWPPPLLFDVAYGCAALKTWGVVDFVQFARGCTRYIYYGSDDDNQNGESGDSSGDTGGAGGSGDEQPGLRRSKRLRNQACKCNNREAARQTEARNVNRLARNTEDGQAVDIPISDMVLALWMQNAKKCRRQASAMKVDSPQEKVRTWLETAES